MRARQREQKGSTERERRLHSRRNLIISNKSFRFRMNFTHCAIEMVRNAIRTHTVPQERQQVE